jgi:hypothetical protein
MPAHPAHGGTRARRAQDHRILARQPPAQVLVQRRDGRIAVVRVRRDRAQADRVEPGVDAATCACERRGRWRRDRADGTGERRPPARTQAVRRARQATRHQLVEDHPHGERIVARVGHPAIGLLGRHVLGRAEQFAPHRAPVAALGKRRIGQLRDPEVDHPGAGSAR